MPEGAGKPAQATRSRTVKEGRIAQGHDEPAQATEAKARPRRHSQGKQQAYHTPKPLDALAVQPEPCAASSHQNEKSPA